MDRGLGTESNPTPVSVDKSIVLDVKPLRSLVPIFPNTPGTSSITNPQPTPFTFAPPSGPFPPGVQPFYPFLAPNGTQHAAAGGQNPPGNFGFGSSIPAPVPLNSFKTPTSQPNGGVSRRKRTYRGPIDMEDDGDSISPNQSEQNGSGFDDAPMNDVDVASNSGKRRGRPRKKRPENGEEFDVVPVLDSFLTAFKLKQFDDFKRSCDDNDIVHTILLVFNMIRRWLTQLEESHGLVTTVTKRPDLKAGAILMSKNIRANSAKRIGHVPGIEVGDIFFFRMELCIVGLHSPSMAGIDYMTVKVSREDDPIAISIVSSGGYDNDGDTADVLVYSGQGGVQRKDGQMFDQKLERGNLAMHKSLDRGNDVRVIRGLKDAGGSTGKVYVYDGVYRIQETWSEKHKLGCHVFKYKLIRVPGQPEAFSLWKTIQQWKDGTTTRTGVILPDLTSGAESQPVVLVNDVDGEKGPAHFTYTPRLKYIKPFFTSNPFSGCRCIGGCQPGDTLCHCNQKNDGLLPYSSLGILLSNKNLVHECGLSCTCPPNCRNRMPQAGLKVRLEVFKTKDKGWSLRSWDPIRAGGFICEYAGDVIDASDDLGNGNDDNYIFDATRYYKPLEALRDDSAAVKKAPFPLVITAKTNGNVARFMNHSCWPNVFWQPVLRESNNDSYLHIAFFAIRHIPPMQELTYDYGIVPAEKGDKGKKKCVCGSAKCRGYFY